MSDVALVVSRDPTLVIGQEEGDSSYLFHDIIAARLLPDGRVAVADRSQTIRVYQANGHIAATIAGRGSGPAELEEITGFWLTAPDTIGVYDSGNLRITTFLADGNLVRTRRLTFPTASFDEVLASSPLPPDFFAGAFDDGGIAVGWTRSGRGNANRTVADQMPLGRFGADGRFAAKIGEVSGLRRFGRSPVPFSPYPHAAVFRDSVYFTDGSKPEIIIRDRNGVIGRTIVVPMTAIEPRAAWTSLEKDIAARPGEYNAQFVRRAQRVPQTDPIPFFAGMFIDDTGVIWLKAYDPVADAIGLGRVRAQQHGNWRLIDQNGELVATAMMPPGLTPLDVRDDKLLGLTKDSLGVERIVVHALQRHKR